MPPLSNFPFLSPAEFRTICVSLERKVNIFRDAVSSGQGLHTTHGHANDGELVCSLNAGAYDVAAVTMMGWREVSIDERNDQTGLRIIKSIDTEPKSVAQPKELENEQDEIEDDDPEALVREQSSRQRAEVEYYIILSPTYQVPVLYFSLLNRLPGTAFGRGPAGPDGLDAIYDYIVPPQFKSNLRDVGVMGGISIGNHPVSGVPTYFVHPCNTADALRDIADTQHEPSTDTYLFLWIGLVGSSVGLHVPSALLAETGVP